MHSERYDAILNYLKNHKRATVRELAGTVYASEATIRRDLAEMAMRGLINRTHGGAVYRDENDETSIFFRQTKDWNEKKEVAKLALNYLPEFHTVFIDNSSTCLALVMAMDLSFKTVITNSLRLAELFEARGRVTTILTGGTVTSDTHGLSGKLALDSLNALHIDLMLTSCAAISDNGAFEFSEGSAMLKRTAFLRSERRILLADKNKFEARATYLTVALKDYDFIITDAPDEAVKPYRDMGIVIKNSTQ